VRTGQQPLHLRGGLSEPETGGLHAMYRERTVVLWRGPPCPGDRQLADFQLQAGQKDEAIKNYKKSLELNPDNEQAIQQLQKLEHRQ
tara:strand:+ start:240140 stop:240400 length:261 start_codon:yes stop_codon:yes gene_type:complete